VILQGARAATAALVHLTDTLNSDVTRIITRDTVRSVLALSNGLWQLELQGHTHGICTSSVEDGDETRLLELARFLVDNREPTMAVPRLSGAAPQRVSREVYQAATHCFPVLEHIMMRDDLKDVVPDKLLLLQGAIILHSPRVS
jgi:hypothetical protein